MVEIFGKLLVNSSVVNVPYQGAKSIVDSLPSLINSIEYIKKPLRIYWF